MEINYKHLKLINFPVFPIPKNICMFNGCLIDSKDRVIDDRNVDKETLGLRRLHSTKYLARLGKQCEDTKTFFEDTKSTFYIDNLGYIFKYKKTKYVDIKYYKIRKIALKDTFTLLQLVSVSHPIKLKRSPPEGTKWVGMLHFGATPWFPYHYSNQYHKKFKRMI